MMKGDNNQIKDKNINEHHEYSRDKHNKSIIVGHQAVITLSAHRQLLKGAQSLADCFYTRKRDERCTQP